MHNEQAINLRRHIRSLHQQISKETDPLRRLHLIQARLDAEEELRTTTQA